MTFRRQARVSLAAVVVALVGVTACSSPPADRGPASSDEGQTSPSGRRPCGRGRGRRGRRGRTTAGAARTAELISSVDPRRVLALGDLAYEDGTAAEFADYYDPTWGDFKAITAPTPGNHEYNSDGRGYFDYFDVAPNYAFDLCGWRIVSVDQYASMRKAAAFIADEGNAAGDTPLLVFWHEPRFSSGSEHRSEPDVQPLWEAAVEAGADIVLNGHDHGYERFEPMGVDGEPQPDGTVEFVSGNGGHSSKRHRSSPRAQRSRRRRHPRGPDPHAEAARIRLELPGHRGPRRRCRYAGSPELAASATDPGDTPSPSPSGGCHRAGPGPSRAWLSVGVSTSGRGPGRVIGSRGTLGNDSKTRRTARRRYCVFGPLAHTFPPHRAHGWARWPAHFPSAGRCPRSGCS